MTTQVKAPKKLSLKAQAALAPKFVFKVIGQDLYACDGKSFLSIAFESDLSKALIFADGFDNSKLGYYQAHGKKFGYEVEMHFLN
jgi:hypothetical protein